MGKFEKFIAYNGENDLVMRIVANASHEEEMRNMCIVQLLIKVARIKVMIIMIRMMFKWLWMKGIA